MCNPGVPAEHLDIHQKFRKGLCYYLPRWLATVGAVIAVFVALFAHELNLDNNQAWGPYRKVFLGLGAITLLGLHARTLAGLVRRRISGLGRPPRSPHEPIAGVAPRILEDLSPAVASPIAEPDSLVEQIAGREKKPLRRWANFITAALCVEFVYLWFVSVGYLTRWPETTAYYDSLAQAFLQGNAFLPIKPDPRLAALENPYSFAERQNIPVVWDASYFDGKYYLYWGPAPAIMLGLLRQVGIADIGDHFIVFVGATVIAIFSGLSILHIWNRYAAQLPAWLLVPYMLVAGFTHPLLWVLNRPAIHEAAIVSGQAFLIGGLFIALPSLEGYVQTPRRLFLAGALWSLAISSRLVLLSPVAVLCGIVILRSLRSAPSRVQGKKIPLAAVSLVLPLSFTLFGLGLYNNSRFGNPFELGWRYHLSGRGDYSQGAEVAFSPLFLPPNLYNYAARHVSTLAVFPFIKPIWGRDTLSPLPIELPEAYYAEQVAGILVTTPFLVFFAYLVRWLVCSESSRSLRQTTWRTSFMDTDLERSFRLLMAGLASGAIFAALPILFYFTASTRFMLDATPLFTIAAIGGSWIAISRARGNRARSRITVISVLILIVLGISASFLLAVTGFESRFEHLNPLLFDRITRFLAW